MRLLPMTSSPPTVLPTLFLIEDYRDEIEAAVDEIDARNLDDR